MNTKKIQSLSELRQAKKELAQKRKVTRLEFGKQLKIVRHDVNSVLLKKVILPIGIGVIGGFVIKYFLTNKNDDRETDRVEKQRVEEEKNSAFSWFSIISIIMNALRIFQGMMHDKEEKKHREKEEEFMETTAGEQQQHADAAEEPPFQPKDFVSNYQQFVRARSETP